MRQLVVPAESGSISHDSILRSAGSPGSQSSGRPSVFLGRLGSPFQCVVTVISSPPKFLGRLNVSLFEFCMGLADEEFELFLLFWEFGDRRHRFFFLFNRFRRLDWDFDRYYCVLFERLDDLEAFL